MHGDARPARRARRDRQDLIADAAGQAHWADLLHRAVEGLEPPTRPASPE
ncbi:MAG: hypothetical protein R3C69_13980 [Geminicoccaceae bacterium]